MVAALVLIVVGATRRDLGRCLVALLGSLAAGFHGRLPGDRRLSGVSGESGSFMGFDTSSGTVKLPFGVLRWTSSGTAHSVSSLVAAAASTGLPLRTPAGLPAGVGAITDILVQPRVTATIRFGRGRRERFGSLAHGGGRPGSARRIRRR